jgi:potassium/hydrogen antiporter
MFVIFGLLAAPSQFLEVLVPGIVLAVVLILIARPLAVVACLMPFRFTANEQAFVGWVGLRGAVSLMLAIVPLTAGLPDGRTIFNLAYVIVIASLLVQGWTIRRMAQWLRLIVPPRTGAVDRVELELPGDVDQDLVSYVVHPKSTVSRGQRPPGWARPSLVIREGQVVAAHRRRFLQAGDRVYVFAPHPRIPLLDRLYGGARPIDQDDREFFGDLVLAPDALTETVATMYDLTVADLKPGLTLAELFRQEFGGAIEPGDRMRFGPVELIARDVNEHGTVTAIGMALEPMDAGLARINVKAMRRNAFNAIHSWLKWIRS